MYLGGCSEVAERRNIGDWLRIPCHGVPASTSPTIPYLSVQSALVSKRSAVNPWQLLGPGKIQGSLPGHSGSSPGATIACRSAHPSPRLGWLAACRLLKSCLSSSEVRPRRRTGATAAASISTEGDGPQSTPAQSDRSPFQPDTW